MMRKELLEITCERNPELKGSIDEYMKIHQSMLIYRTNFERLMEANKVSSPEALRLLSNMKKCTERLKVLTEELKEINSHNE